MGNVDSAMASADLVLAIVDAAAWEPEVRAE